MQSHTSKGGEDKCSRKPGAATQEGLVRKPSTSTRRRQVEDEDEERWQGWQSRQKPSEMETSAISTNYIRSNGRELLDVCWSSPEVAACRSQDCLFHNMPRDLFSDAETIHADVIFLSTCTDLPIFSVISNPGLRVAVPGSLRKDREIAGS